LKIRRHGVVQFLWPCIGQWKRADGVKGKAEFDRQFLQPAIFLAVTTASTKPLSFLASPEVVTAYALSGDLGFGSVMAKLKGADGKEFKLEPPQGERASGQGFRQRVRKGLLRPAASGEGLTVEVSPTSERLQPIAALSALGRQGLWRNSAVDQDQRQDDDRSHFLRQDPGSSSAAFGKIRTYVLGANNVFLPSPARGTTC